MNFFKDTKTEQEIKARYKQLAKQNHPDLGGCVETMKIVNAEYEISLTKFYQVSGKSITEIDELLAKDHVLRSKLNEIINCEGLEIEICGSWIWVTGLTKDFKDILKTNGFFWASKKKAWYWRQEENKSYNRKSFDLNEIRFKHGSVKMDVISVKKLG